MDLTQRFYRFLKSENLILTGERVLVALSGGKDSVCLLHLLLAAQEEFGFFLGACHIHHGIRGEEADRDAAFCKEICEKLSIPLFTEYCDVPAFCKENKLGSEEGARILRYRLLNEVAEREGFQKIATAHSASDQAETLLFRLIRGTGFCGARGIPAKRENIIRPLLPFHSEEIESYLKNRGIPFIEDSSNWDTIYSRNLIRNDIFPLMEKINPRTKDALNRFGEMSVWQEALLEKLWKETEKKNGFSLVDGFLPLKIAVESAKNEADFPILFYALSHLAKKHNITIDFVHFKAILSLLKHPLSGKIIEISDGFVFKIEKDRLIFQKNESLPLRIEYQIELSAGETPLPDAIGSIFYLPDVGGKNENINKKSLNIKLDSDRISGGLKARSLRQGDRILMYGMHKSIKKMLCDSGIPQELRQKIPVIFDDDEILWVPFLGLCDKLRGENASNVAELRFVGATAERIRLFCEKEKTKTP